VVRVTDPFQTRQRRFRFHLRAISPFGQKHALQKMLVVGFLYKADAPSDLPMFGFKAAFSCALREIEL
jgi:hypothetical protein